MTRSITSTPVMLKNGCGLVITQANGKWYVEAMEASSSAWVDIVWQADDQQFSDWIEPVLAIESLRMCFPPSLVARIDCAKDNPRNMACRQEVEKWLARAAKIELLSETGKRYSLARIDSFAFTDYSIVSFSAPGCWPSADRTERTSEEMDCLKSELKTIALALGWPIKPHWNRQSNQRFCINEHTRRATWREALISMTPVFEQPTYA